LCKLAEHLDTHDGRSINRIALLIIDAAARLELGRQALVTPRIVAIK
jgi:hypothetical protein